MENSLAHASHPHKVKLSAEEYRKLTAKVSKVAIIIASIMIVIKAFATIISHSISLSAALLDSVFDLACSLMNYFILRQASKPADDDHQFGHGKIEYFGTLGQSLFISTTAIFLILNAIDRFNHPQEITSTGFSIAILGVSMLLTLVLVLYQQKVIQLTNSQLVKSDQAHYKMDFLLNGSVMIAIVFASIGYSKVDVVLAILIALYMIWSMVGVLKTAFDGLTDKVLPEEDIKNIQYILDHHPQVLAYHDLRTRQSANTKHIQFHLELADTLTLRETHDICDEIEHALMGLFTDALITIHPEPKSVAQAEQAGTYQPKTNPELEKLVKECLESSAED